MFEKLAAFQHALGKRKVDVCVVNELSAAVPPTFRGYSWFLAKDDRPFRGTAINVHSNWAKLVTKVPDVDKEMDMELIHLRVSNLQTLHIIGAYLDSKPTVGHAAHVQARLEEKIEEIKAWGEECLLIGDLNRNVDKPTELPKTRLMQTWFDSGKVELLNNPKVHTRIDPVTGRGSTLELAVITPGLRS